MNGLILIHRTVSNVRYYPFIFRCGLEMGCLYAVEHSGTWYRCKLETLKSDEANVFLVDAGITLVVDGARLRRLEDRFLEEPFLAVRCSLWGLKPAGHVDRWSRTSHDKMEEVFKTASKLFIEIYRNSLTSQLHLVLNLNDVSNVFESNLTTQMRSTVLSSSVSIMNL